MNLLLLILLEALIATASAQGAFQNLNFENASVSGRIGGGIPIAQALPGWEVILNGSPTDTIVYDDRNIDLWGASIHDSQSSMTPISGNFSVYLQGGRRGFPDNATGPAAIAQTGTVGLNTHSLLFSASIGVPDVSFNGQTLSVFEIQNNGTYDTYGADISAFAGQSGELRFTTQYPNAGLLDDIQFSSVVIPEPGTLAMLTTGVLLLMTFQKRKARETN